MAGNYPTKNINEHNNRFVINELYRTYSMEIEKFINT